MPYEAFHTGYKRTVMAPDELLTRVRVPCPGPGFHFFRKVGTRAAQAVSKVCLAAFARVEAGMVAGVPGGAGQRGPGPLPGPGAPRRRSWAGRLDALPLEAARDALLGDISPIDDIRSTAHYRRTVAGNVLVQALLELVADFRAHV